MAGKHSITFFPVRRARGFPLELCMKLGDIDYDYNIMTFDKWPEMKHTTSFASLPIITLPDGSQLTQSVAICYYLGSKANLLYDDVMLDSRIMELVNAIQDLYHPWSRTVNMDPEAKQKAREELFKAPMRESLMRIDESIGRTTKGYSVGDKITIADVYVFAIEEFFMMPRWDHVPKDLFDNYKNLKMIRTKMMENPKVKAHMSSLTVIEAKMMEAKMMEAKMMEAKKKEQLSQT